MNVLGMLHNGCYSSPTSARVRMESFSDPHLRTWWDSWREPPRTAVHRNFILMTVHAQCPAIYQNWRLIAHFTLWLQLQILVAVSVLMHLSLHRFQGGGFLCDFSFLISLRKVSDLQFVQVFSSKDTRYDFQDLYMVEQTLAASWFLESKSFGIFSC